jgi:hypothetical protein
VSIRGNNAEELRRRGAEEYHIVSSMEYAVSRKKSEKYGVNNKLILIKETKKTKKTRKTRKTEYGKIFTQYM